MGDNIVPYAQGYGVQQGVMEVSYDTVKSQDPYQLSDDKLSANIQPMNFYNYVKVLNNLLDTANDSLTRFKENINQNRKDGKLTTDQQYKEILQNYQANFPYRELILFMTAVKQTFATTPPPVSLCINIQNIMRRASRYLNDAAIYDIRLSEKQKAMYRKYIATYDCSASIKAFRDRVKIEQTPEYHWALGKITKETQMEFEDSTEEVKFEKDALYPTAFGDGEESEEGEEGKVISRVGDAVVEEVL